MPKFIKNFALEGAVAKRSDSVYQPGQRTGLWSKYRINLGQEFVVGGYIPSHLGVDSVVVGFYRGKDLIYAARVRAGLVPSTRGKVFEHIKHLKTPLCPFSNLPEPARQEHRKDQSTSAVRSAIRLGQGSAQGRRRKIRQ